MKYLIENKVIFHPTEESLTGVNERSDITEKLPRPTSKLLLELIKRRGETIPRPTLLDSVWEAQGAVASDAALNNHLSLIRKRFDFWGIDRNKLKTIPRQGVLLNINIEEQPSTPATEGTPHAAKHPPHNIKSNKHFMTNKGLGHYFSYITFIIILISLGVGGAYIHFSSDGYEPVLSIANVDSCNIKPIGNTLTDISTPDAHDALKIVEENAQALNCTIPQDIYLSVTTLSDKRMIFLTTCIIAANDSYQACKNISYVEKRD
ncbi:Uncharacterised protein [Serratia fonticola]|uniref:winged helix-turn-helix domain-containing protein n=1 Tax=Serratia fonticola TaxID=47917 RepID=UPI000413F2EB|nr:winged helix-turn-helix domain-containing protein [Serratia fonticola]CAI1684238.1 Uncharacterised protein [Serratia fonticola]